MMKSEKFCVKQKQSKSKKKKNKFYSPAQITFGYGLKFISLILIALIASPTIFRVGQTQAYFIDVVEPMNITSTVATLSFNASGSDFAPHITPTDNSFRAMNLQNTGTLDFNYQIQTANVATNTFCGALELKDNISGVFMPLNSFLSATGTISILPNISLEARLASSSQSLIGQTCQFDLVFTGWQTDFPDASLGFSYTQTIPAIITAGDWQETPPSHTVVAGDVAINELMWMGSASSTADEWLELRNMTGNAIDIGGWQLTKKSSGSEVLMLTIPAGKTIAPNGLFLISDYDQEHSAINVAPDLVVGSGSTNDSDFALANSDLQIKLYKDDWASNANLIDTADDGVGIPAAGSNGTAKESMERNDISSDGTIASNWHPCVDSSSTALYWDVGRTEMGTPDAPNLSDENPPIADQNIVLELLTTENTITTEEITLEETAPDNTPDLSSGEEPAPTESVTEDSSPSDDQTSEVPIDDTAALTDKPLDGAPIVPVSDAGGGE